MWDLLMGHRMALCDPQSGSRAKGQPDLVQEAGKPSDFPPPANVKTAKDTERV